MDVQEVRRRNLIWLLESYRDSNPKATDKDFAVVHDINPKHLSQIKNRSKGARDVGNGLARRIELSLRVARGWLDQPQWSSQSVTTRRGISVPRLEHLRASMGLGIIPQEHEQVVERIDLDPTWARRQFRILSSPENLAFVVGWGDSMSPTYNHGDILFVDTGVTEVKVDAVYVFSLSQELFIKRLQRLPDTTLRVISDNKQYEPYVLDVRQRKDMRTHGRVVGAMNWRQL